MSKQANPTVIGGFVLGALVLVVVAILVFSSGAWMRERVAMVTYFETTVQGLNVGSQVLFQGVPVGQVTGIGVDYDATQGRVRIPVRYEIWPKQLHILDATRTDGGDLRSLLRELVAEQGLRAKLESVSFVTGQYVITLSLDASASPLTSAQEARGPVEVPPTPATRDQLEEMLQNIDLGTLVGAATGTLVALEELLRSPALHSALENLDGTLSGTRTALSELNAELRPLLRRADETFAAYRELAVTLEAQVNPLATRIEQRVDALSADISRVTQNLDASIGPVTNAATGALTEAGAAMRAITELAGEGSTTRYELSQLLTEATRAARSLRSLADYLERHPESLIQGKR
ncbi:MlaD family protein [Thiohalocapsa sp.]|jgi:paraquat-inducible protein B|uniref:MlaD family protein n=1 Tax=Thiohalocapsa sp. TaxID=2497641 RepID=UPI0025DCEBF7|nr:MlaD family protein [Thiohalocapsa sp.]